ncbi:MAG: efflux transporter periplasmic adaptor subunit, partial [Candidatus Aminicenantes bacterium]|nr:efflux transporter periplasmic adaptor subunit [Candidatus Aminicenantes bacterium]
TMLDAEIGAFKAPGANIGQIDVLDAYSVRAQIDEHYITRVEVGKAGSFDLAGKSYGLKVRRVFPAVRDNRFEVDLDFVGAAPPDLRRGQTLHIKLELGDIAEALLIARGAFWDTTGGNWIYILDGSGKVAVKHTIRLGRYNPEVYEVLEGLKPGDQVITSSYESFGDMERLVLK